MHTEMGTIAVTLILTLYFQISIVSTEYISHSVIKENGKYLIDTVKSPKCGHGYSKPHVASSSSDIDNKVIISEDSKDENKIRFDTEKKAKDYHIRQAVRNDQTAEELNYFDMEEEQEVDDIPFDTKKVYYSIMLNKKEFFMDDEAEADDIPFDTRKIYEELMNI